MIQTHFLSFPYLKELIICWLPPIKISAGIEKL